jgi:drug/metabolite transporter (DMT)-like permease
LSNCRLVLKTPVPKLLDFAVPVAVFLLGVFFGLEEMNGRMLGTMAIISGGVVIASYGEVNFNWIGVVYMMGGVLGEAFRLIFIELLLKKKGLKLDPITMMYYVSPCRLVVNPYRTGCVFVWDAG